MTTTQTLPRNRPVTALEGFTLTVARLAERGMDPAAATGYLLLKMAAERPELYAQTVEAMRADQNYTARLADLIGA